MLPFALHGEGAVLGDIDDASRECVVADSLSEYGWRVPPDERNAKRHSASKEGMARQTEKASPRLDSRSVNPNAAQ